MSYGNYYALRLMQRLMELSIYLHTHKMCGFNIVCIPIILLQLSNIIDDNIHDKINKIPGKESRSYKFHYTK